MLFKFNETIDAWQDWERVFQNIEAWRPLIAHIYARERLPLAEIEHLTPGSNAVFRTGQYVVKIFAPEEAFPHSPMDFASECFGQAHANRLGVSVPRLVTHGAVEDKYLFRYTVSEFIEGRPLKDVPLTDAEKVSAGSQLRGICDRWNTPCAPWGGLRLPECLLAARYVDGMREDGGFTERFIAERARYLRQLPLDPAEFVYCHADLCMDNYLLREDGDIAILDFADSQYAPVCVEHAVAAAGFEFEKPYLQGFFGNISAEELTELCLRGLLLSINGRYIFDYFCPAAKIESLDFLKELLHRLIENGGMERHE